MTIYTEKNFLLVLISLFLYRSSSSNSKLIAIAAKEMFNIKKYSIRVITIWLLFIIIRLVCILTNWKECNAQLWR